MNNLHRILKKKAERKIRRNDNVKFMGSVSPPKPKLLARPDLVKRNDEVCSKYIVARDKLKWEGYCPFGVSGFVLSCKRERRLIQCWFHFIKRSRSERLRWDYARNIVGSCFPCNGYMENNEAPFWAWYVREHGSKKMMSLVNDSHGSSGFGRIELDLIYDDIKKQMAILSGTI